jgi:hypothetical protein
LSDAKCPAAGAIDFHFVNAGTALFGLNNRVYRMERKAH